MQHISELLKRLEQRRGDEHSHLTLERLQHKWLKQGIKPLCERASVLRLDGHTVVLVAKAPEWVSEVRYRKQEILRWFQKQLGTEVNDIRCVIIQPD